MIHVRITKTFTATRDSAAFELRAEFESASPVTVLFGPSGSGKTMTLDSIAGFIRPDAGRIALGDRILFDSPKKTNLPPERRACGYVFQNYALFPHMTVRANLEFAANTTSTGKVTELLERFHLSAVAGRKPHEISGGQKQRCSIARALVGDPKLLLLDEPGQGLDATLKAELFALLREVRDVNHVPIILVTHDLAECRELGGQMVVMHEGRVIQIGPVENILARPANDEVASLLGNK